MLLRRAAAGAAALALPSLARAAPLAKIRERGTLSVGLYKDMPPFHADGRGIDAELGAALAQALGLRIAPLPFPADENMDDDLRNMVWRGHYLGYGPADVMLQVPADRFLANGNPQVTIMAPYMRQSNVLLHDSRRLASAATPEDLKGLPLAAERGAGAASVLMGYGGGLLRNQVSIYPTGVEAAQAVIDGKAAAAFVLRAQAEAALFQRKASVEQFPLSKLNLNNGIADTGWPVGMAIKAAHKDLGTALDTAMKSLRESGELLAMFKQHGLTLTAP